MRRLLLSRPLLALGRFFSLWCGHGANRGVRMQSRCPDHLFAAHGFGERDQKAGSSENPLSAMHRQRDGTE